MSYISHINKYASSQAIQDAVNNGTLANPYVAINDDTGLLDWNMKVKFDVDADDMEFPGSGGTSAITITASEPWTVTIPSWLTASSLSGNTRQVVTITAQATQQANEGTIRITNGTKTFTVNAEQAEPAIDYSTMYFTIEALESGEFLNQSNSFSYSVNGGEWTATDWETPIQVQTGDKIRFKSQSDEIMYCGDGIVNFDFIVYGNIMSLMYGDNFTGQTENTVSLSNMFADNAKLISAEHLILPSTTLYGYEYSTMFTSCYNLTTPPALPATTLGEYCYQNMFFGCSGLTTFPALPATTLAEGCYSGMFNGCYGMETAPVLPALTLEVSCYQGMFYDCGNLMNVTCLATDISATDCLSDWLEGASFVGTLHKNPLATSIWLPGTNIPDEWTVQDYSA